MTVKKLVSTILSDLFLASLVLYLAGTYIDLSQPGSISRAFNLSVLLVVCAGAGFLSVLIGQADEEKKKKPLLSPWIYTVALSSAAGILIWQALIPLSSFAVIFGAGGGSIVFFACFAMMSNDNSH
ncbi:MAG: hypothetical protein Q8P56_03855 [Candidatus Uhrbacteria bacterium]|nr:hypothetical protein [Candidatus Uhrbacteria bacterium]